jgi:hypothetical protein
LLGAGGYCLRRLVLSKAQASGADEGDGVNQEETFMSLTDEDVITIMRYLDESKFEELHLNVGDVNQ